MNIQRTYIVAFVACFLLVLGSAQAQGQTADDVANLREFIAQNAELLMKARELVRETSSAKARASLEVATRLHKESVLYLDRNLARAAQLAKQAREAILQTIALAKREATLAERAHNAIERAVCRLEQGRQLLAENHDRESLSARKLLEEAQGLLKRARDNMREHLFEVALRLAVSSEQLSTRAIALLRSDFYDPESIAQALEKTDRVLERVSEQLNGDVAPAARRMFREARELQRKAKESLRSGNPRLALELTRRSRRMAMRVLQMLSGRPNLQNVEQAIQLTDMLLLEAKEIALARNADNLLNRIERAERTQREARLQFDQGRLERALNLTLRARKILTDAVGAVKQALHKPEVRKALTQTDELLSRLAAALEGSDNGPAGQLFERARVNQDKAWREFRNDRLRAALAHTKLARRLARRALRQLGNDDM